MSSSDHIHVSPSPFIVQPSSGAGPQLYNQRPQVAFISGHIEVDCKYFEEYYIPNIQTAVSAGHYFVIGPAEGIDTIALDYLLNTANVDPQRITVYFAEFQKSDLAGIQKHLALDGHTVNIKVEGLTTGQRDEAMTMDSDYDILRFMTEDEQRALYGQRYYPRISNTEKNYRRRRGLPLHENTTFLTSQNEVADLQLASVQMTNARSASAKRKWKNKWFVNWLQAVTKST